MSQKRGSGYTSAVVVSPMHTCSTIRRALEGRAGSSFRLSASASTAG
jgi:hypothetical protein